MPRLLHVACADPHPTFADWLKKRADYLRDAIHAAYFYPEGNTGGGSAAARAPPPASLLRLAQLVTVPPLLDRASVPFGVAEQFRVLCAATENARNDARLAYGGGAGADSATRARYADSIAALAAQCRQILPLLQPPAAVADDEPIVLD